MVLSFLFLCVLSVVVPLVGATKENVFLTWSGYEDEKREHMRSGYEDEKREHGTSNDVPTNVGARPLHELTTIT